MTCPNCGKSNIGATCTMDFDVFDNKVTGPPDIDWVFYCNECGADICDDEIDKPTISLIEE